MTRTLSSLVSWWGGHKLSSRFLSSSICWPICGFSSFSRFSSVSTTSLPSPSKMRKWSMLFTAATMIRFLPSVGMTFTSFTEDINRRSNSPPTGRPRSIGKIVRCQASTVRSPTAHKTCSSSPRRHQAVSSFSNFSRGVGSVSAGLESGLATRCGSGAVEVGKAVTARATACSTAARNRSYRADSRPPSNPSSDASASSCAGLRWRVEPARRPRRRRHRAPFPRTAARASGPMRRPPCAPAPWGPHPSSSPPGGTM